MSWTDVGSYFRSRLNSFDGLREWEEPFDAINIPSTILDGAYNFDYGEFTGDGVNQNDLESTVRLTIRVFKKGFYNPNVARDDSIALAELIVRDVLNPVNRLSQTFKNVDFDSLSVKPLSEQNDNAMMIEMNFNIRDVLEVC